MIVLGDVFAVVAVLIGLFLTGTATVVLLNLLAPGRVDRAGERLEGAPWRALGVGVLLGVPAFLASAVVAGVPMPLIKLIGIIAMMLVLLACMTGIAGISQIVARRIRALDPTMAPAQAMTRAAMILMGAAMFPLVGWFLVAPIMLVSGFGLWVQSLRSERASEAWNTPNA